MKKIYFRKTTAYDLGKRRSDTFEYLQGVGFQKIDPSPLSQFKNLPESKIIFYSPLARVKDSLPFNSRYDLRERNELREVLFDLKLFCTEDEFKREGSVIIRRKFKQFFISDTLPIKRNAIFAEVEKILEDISLVDASTVTVISHSFRLKIFEAYLGTNGEIVNNPSLINTYITDDEKTFQFEEGFDIILKNKQ